MQGITVTPLPGFVIKTKTDLNRKAFINICTSDVIESPTMKKKLNDDGEEVEGLNIPISVGPGRERPDKSGILCLVYDVMVNPKVVEEAIEDKTGKQRDFLCQLSIQAIEQKYSTKLDNRYKLPKLKSFGELEQQYIRDPAKTPKIEECSSKAQTCNKNSKKQSVNKKKDIKIEEITEEAKLQYSSCFLTEEQDSQYQQSNMYDHSQCDNAFIGEEYIEPLSQPAQTLKSILLSFEIITSRCSVSDFSKIQLKASPFRLFVSAS
jgi:hypothetical protein